MARQDPAAYAAYRDANFLDNSSGLITPLTMRNYMDQMAENHSTAIAALVVNEGDPPAAQDVDSLATNPAGTKLDFGAGTAFSTHVAEAEAFLADDKIF